MAGKKTYGRDPSSFTTGIVPYRDVAAADATPEAVQEAIDLSDSQFAMNTVVLYVRGTTGDTLSVFVRTVGTSFLHENLTLAGDNEVFIVENVPAVEVAVQVTATAAGMAIYEEHTE